MFSLEAPSEVEGIVDVCIIGAGPAGMTAAVYLARKKLSAAIVSKDVGGQVAWTLGIENYMGYQYITGRELTAKFEEQVGSSRCPLFSTRQRASTGNRVHSRSRRQAEGPSAPVP